MQAVKIRSPILSILIPTYNRSNYLRLNLACLIKELSRAIHLADKIEIIVSDNASSDDTKQVFSEYSQYEFLKFLESGVNIGPESNFLKLVSEAKGQYIWLLGDDEAVLHQSLEKLTAVIEKYPDAGLFHIVPTAHNSLDDFDFFKTREENSVVKYNDPNEFLIEVGYGISFISSHVFNRRYLGQEIEPKDFVGTSLVQLTFFLQSALKAPYNVLVMDFLFSQLVDNTGGYNLFKTFATNQNRILNYFKTFGLSERVIRSLNKKMLKKFFPAYIARSILKKSLTTSKIKGGNISLESPFKTLFQNYKFYIEFWIFCFPLLIVPHELGSIVLRVVKFMRNKIRRPSI